MRNTIVYIATICALCCLATSCRKEYHNCQCTYLNEYDEVDTLLISVRATNRTKADKGCADAEIEIAVKENFFVFCQLQ